jgi:hypothetical protein
MLKNPAITWKSHLLAKFDHHLSPILPPFANRGVSRRLTCSASGDERGNKTGFSTISFERMQYGRRDSSSPTIEEEECQLILRM